MAEQLLAAGATLNAVSTSGWTPLDCACHNKRTDVMELLFSAGAENGPAYEALRVRSKGNMFETFSLFGMIGLRERLKSAGVVEDSRKGAIAIPKVGGRVSGCMYGWMGGWF